MSFQSLSVPGVVINGDKMSIVPNSFKYKGGEGETNVRAASTGGGAVQSVHSVNAEDKISQVMFDMFLTGDTDKLIREWSNAIGANTIEAVQSTNQGGITKTFTSMSLVNHVERDAGADGVVSLEFKGDPMIG